MILAETATVTPYLIILVGSGGALGAFVTLFKLRGDRDSQAVTQAATAAEALAESLGAVERERDYWKSRYEACHQARNELLAQIQVLTRGDRPA